MRTYTGARVLPAHVAEAHKQHEAMIALPDGVPVAIMSPGCNVMAAEMVEMR